MAKKLPFLVLMLAFFMISSQGVFAADKSVVYDYNDGDIALMRDGRGIPLKSDLQIQNGDIIRTDAGGILDILMNQLAGVRFQTASECLVVEIKSSSMHLFLSEGQALANLKTMPSGGEFTLETPNAIIETTLITQLACTVTNTDNRTTTVIAIKKGRGFVRVKSSGAEISVLDNQAVEITPETFITPPRTLSEEEVKLLNKTNSIIITTDF